MVEDLKTIEVGFTDYIAARQKEFDWFRQGKEQGYEEGIEQGAHQKALETAKAMLSLGLPLDQIQLCTSLSLDVVLSLTK